jgi:Protein of unknown function (DUF1353)
MTPPLITYDAHQNTFILEEDFHSQPTSILGTTIVIPKGFECDLSSVPRALWNIAAPFELSVGGALTHDWLYRHTGLVHIIDSQYGECLHQFTRANADQFYLDYMKVEGVTWLKRTAAYRLVRLFGGSSWKFTPITIDK